MNQHDAGAGQNSQPAVPGPGPAEHPLPHAGDEAPDFAWTEDGQSRRLSQLRGQPVLLLFYPLAYAHTDRQDVVHLEEAWERLGGDSVHRLAISVDTVEQARQFFEHYGAEHLHPVSDPGLAIAQSYGVRRAEAVAERASVLIDAEGQVVQAEIHDFCFPRSINLLESWLAEMSED